MGLSDTEASHTPDFQRVAECLYRRKSSGVYYAFIKRNGKQYRRSLHTRDREIAGRKLRELRGEIGSLASDDARGLTFAVMADRWQDSIRHENKESTVKRRQLYVDALAPYFKGVSLKNITPAHCQKWLAERGQTLAPQTFAHELEALKSVFDYAREQDLILRNPAEGIKRKRIVQKQIQVPSLREFQSLVSAIRASDGRPDSQAKARGGADMVELLAYSGLRLGEGRALRWEDVHFDAKPTPFMRVTGGERRTKNHESRIVPLSKALFGLLSRLHRERNPQAPDAVLQTGSARKCMETACRKLGLPDFTHHSLRHFYATTAIESGVDIPTVSRWLGHKDGGALAMRVYGHLRQEHSFSQIERVSFTPAPETEHAENVLPLDFTGENAE